MDTRFFSWFGEDTTPRITHMIPLRLLKAFYLARWEATYPWWCTLDVGLRGPKLLLLQFILRLCVKPLTKTTVEGLISAVDETALKKLTRDRYAADTEGFTQASTLFCQLLVDRHTMSMYWAAPRPSFRTIASHFGITGATLPILLATARTYAKFSINLNGPTPTEQSDQSSDSGPASTERGGEVVHTRDSQGESDVESMKSTGLD